MIGREGEEMEERTLYRCECVSAHSVAHTFTHAYVILPVLC